MKQGVVHESREQFGNSLSNFRSYHSCPAPRGRSFLYIFLLFLLVYLIGSIYIGAQLSSASIFFRLK